MNMLKVCLLSERKKNNLFKLLSHSPSNCEPHWNKFPQEMHYREYMISQSIWLFKIRFYE